MSAGRYWHLKKLIEYAEEVGEDENDWFIGVVQSLRARWNDRLYSLTFQSLQMRDRRLLLHTEFPIPQKREDMEAINGPYKIGTIAGTGIDFGFTKLHINRHGLIIGDSGTGKSTVIKILARQLINDEGVRLLIIDPKEGGDYRFLAKLTDNVVILRPRQLKLNPFTHIPAVPLAALREALIEVVASSYKVLDASEGVIAKHVARVFSEYEQPTFYDFAKSLRSEKPGYGGRKQGYLDGLETRLLKTLISLRDILDCKADYFTQLADCHVVIETGELSGGMQHVIVNWLMMKELLYSIKNMDRRVLRVYGFDESQGNIFPRYQGQLRTPYMATLVTQARAFNVGLLALAHNPSLILPQLIGNSCIKLAFHMGSGREIVEMAGHMGLSSQQTSELYLLNKKETICRLGVGYMEPVRVDIYDYEDDPVSNEELAEIMKPKWDALLEGIEPAQDRPSPALKAQKPSALPAAEGTQDMSAIDPAPGSELCKLSEDEQAYLRLNRSHPFRLLTEMYAIVNDEKIMGNNCISQSRAVKIRKKLLQLEYLETFPVLGTGKSGRSQSDIVTEKAGLGKVYEPRGGLLHSFWVYRAAAYYKSQGEKPVFGDTSSGREIDISTGDIGVEIVVNSLVTDNLEQHLAYYSEVLILAIDTKKAKEIQAQLKDFILRPVRVELLKDYFISLV